VFLALFFLKASGRLHATVREARPQRPEHDRQSNKVRVLGDDG